jgi:cyclic AMP-dependent transcription factor ATF-4
MAQLPPKVPTMAPAWPEFGGGHHHRHHHHHQRSPSMGAFLAAPMPPLPPPAPANGQPSWVDEFLDFSAAKRGAHRRTVSDSVAFLDDAGNAGAVGAHEFDRLDDDQLMSMFSDQLAAPPTTQQQQASASSPSDHNSINDDKGDTEEAQSDCNGDGRQPSSPATADPKRVKR